MSSGQKAYDEEAERVKFEACRSDTHNERHPGGDYLNANIEFKWQGWKLCAKSREVTK